MRTYLDYAATAPLRPQARARVIELLDIFGNPSSIHAEGQAARLELDEARRTTASLLGLRAERLAFTSGGTEANNLALRGVMARAPGKRLLVSSIEHDCIRNTGFALNATEIPVDSHGLLNMEVLTTELKRGDVALVSVMHANNENGVLQPVSEIATLAHAHGALFHTDAIQTVGHLPVQPDDIGADLLSFAGHKFGGPKGVGALVLKPEITMDALITGGSQERNRRAGTENLPAIGGMATALQVALENLETESTTARHFRTQLEAAALQLGLTVVGLGSPTAPHVIQLLTHGQRGEDVVIAFDLKGIAISQGSACGSGKVKESHVLKAMGYTAQQAGQGLRLSWGHATTQADIDHGIAALGSLLKT
ncbi:MAG: cysteine desulfurase [Pseudomonas fluorescens]|nr:MAG: cysteine desulfurase [Pseudomonas fluorescens]